MPLHDITKVRQAIATGQIREHVQQGVELKSTWSSDNGKKISGLSNRIGDDRRWLLIGIDDSGKVIGHGEKWARNTEQIVSQQINQFLDPPHACRAITCLDMAGWVVAIEIANPGTVTRWAHKAYRMPGTTVAEMTPQEALELTLKLPGLTDYTKQPWDGVVAGPLVREFSGLIEHPDDRQDALGSMGLSGRQAARILFGPCRFRAVWFDWDDRIVANESHDGLITLLTPAFRARIQEWSRPSPDANDPYPESVLREALANAVAHAAYFDRDGDVMMEVHRDRLVASNLCVPQAEYFANKWFSRAHWTLNALLMEALRAVKIVDELGRGKQLIFRESLLAGKQQPLVDVDPAGQLNRWRLTVYGGIIEERRLRLLERLRDVYGDTRKALVAQALILWANEPLEKIRGYMDGESQKVLAEVLEHPRCPVIYGQDDLQRARWVRVLLEEGQDSKVLTPAEEQAILRATYDFANKNNGVFTTAQFRDLAGLGHTRSEQTQANSVLNRWMRATYIERRGKGRYAFKAIPPVLLRAGSTHDLVQRIIDALLSDPGRHRLPSAGEKSVQMHFTFTTG